MLKVVFFDIDDTLLDTSVFAQLARNAAVEAMVNEGLPLSNKEAHNLLKEVIKEKGSNYGKHFNVLTKAVCGKEEPRIIAAGMITYHNVKFALLRPFPNATEVLINLSRKYELGVISNGITIKQWEKLVRLNLHHFFSEIITSEEIGFEKPSKHIFRAALAKMNCEPQNAVMVGNKFNEDVMGAINAGMSGILVNSKLSKEELDKIRDKKLDIQIISNISELPNLL